MTPNYRDKEKGKEEKNKDYSLVRKVFQKFLEMASEKTGNKDVNYTLWPSLNFLSR